MKDIKEILKFLREVPKMIGMLNMPTEKVDIVQSIREIVYEWKGYKDLENQGKLLKLPCAVGDTVYAHCSEFGLLAYTVDCIVIDENITFQCSSYSHIECLDQIEPNILEFGKTVFLTREEAEAALKGLLTSKQP